MQIVGNTAKPTAPLPVGWIFWRVRVVNGADTSTSATWQFWVGKSSATTSVDSSRMSFLDVNGDGFGDFLVGADEASSNTGAAHLYLGNGTGASFQKIDLTNPDGAGARFGLVSIAGDVNGDGFGDFIVCGFGFSSLSGACHLYLGAAAPSASRWNGAAPADRIDIVAPDGAGGHFGSAAGLGDVNGDGYADFVIGATTASSNTGEVHVYFGTGDPKSSGWNASPPSNRIDLPGPDGATAQFGAPASAGDVNGDGYADFIVGARAAASNSGAAHLYLGEANPVANDWTALSTSKRIDLTSPDVGSALFGAVGAGGDIDNDGYSDFIVGAPGVNSNAGAAHVYFGGATPSTADWNGAAPTKRIDLIPNNGAGGDFGNAVSIVGDINGDGFDDFVVGAAGVNSSSGAASLYLGTSSPSATGWNGASATARIDLTEHYGGGGQFGASAFAAGDADGDGLAEFVIGAPAANFAAGAINVYVGESSPMASDWNGTTASKRIEYRRS